MHGEFITLKEVLHWMDSGQPFSIDFVTASRRNQFGGEWIHVADAIKSGWMNKRDREAQQKLQQPSEGLRKDPRHFENSTRNILITANSSIRKVHIRLIRRFNGKSVL